MKAPRCQKCNHQPLAERDGREIGAFPGIKYQVCPACGWSRAIVRKPTKQDQLNTISHRNKR
jgi:hypothetical protein